MHVHKIIKITESGEGKERFIVTLLEVIKIIRDEDFSCPMGYRGVSLVHGVLMVFLSVCTS